MLCRMPPRAGLRATLRKHTHWVGLVAVMAPLAVLLALQYRWLVELDRTSAVAHRAALANYLEAVTKQVEYFYRTAAERSLNLSAGAFTPERLEKAGLYLKKKPVEGARRLFVVSFLGEQEGQVFFVDPYSASASLEVPPWSPEVRAVYVAVAPWRTLAHKGGVVEPVTLQVDERDPAHRILLNPITDDASRLVGIAGMILDEEDFRRRLPGMIQQAFPDFCEETGWRDLAVSVHDGGGSRILALGDPQAPGESEVERDFSFVFKDWTIRLASRQATAGTWARSNFTLNILLSVALAAVLLGGVVLALRTASREMRLSQMKGDFVSNVSHELRTPLASIRVFGEFLRLGRAETPEKVREYGEYIEAESRRLTRLINNILDFSRIESGQKTYQFERADVVEVVAETLKVFQVRLRQEGFKLVFRGPDSPLPPIYLDAGAIAQSLSNLLDNAVKYSNGGKEITVSLGREGDFVVISVRDQGIGIPREEQEKIFDRFHRVGSSLVHDVKGTGLGLAIVQHIVQAHRGRVGVESRPGQGSTFSIYLPVGPPEAGTHATLEVAEAPASPGVPEKRPSEA